jgi:DNA-binding IclR family transcriptional regulator
MARSSAGESALTRALGILDAFSIDTPFLTVSEIARRAGRPVSSTHRTVKELASHGLLESMGDRRYRLGNRLWEIGARTPGALGLREIAQRFLLDLHQRLGQHVQLAVQYGTEALTLDRLSEPDAVINATVVGGHMPLPHTALGLVLLAYGSDNLVDQVVAEGLRPPTSAALHTEAQLQKALEETRERGYAMAAGYIHAGSRGIAVPVVGANGVVVAALGMVVPNDASPALPLALELRRTAIGIGKTLTRAYLPAGHPDALPGGASRYLVNSSTSSMEFLARPRRSSRRASTRAGPAASSAK